MEAKAEDAQVLGLKEDCRMSDVGRGVGDVAAT